MVLQVEARVTEALNVQHHETTESAQQALAAQEAAMHAAAAALDGQLRAAVSQAAAVAASSTEEWQDAVERRLSRFEAVFQRMNAAFAVLSRCASGFQFTFTSYQLLGAQLNESEAG